MQEAQEAAWGTLLAPIPPLLPRALWNFAHDPWAQQSSEAAGEPVGRPVAWQAGSLTNVPPHQIYHLQCV